VELTWPEDEEIVVEDDGVVVVELPKVDPVVVPRNSLWKSVIPPIMATARRIPMTIIDAVFNFPLIKVVVLAYNVVRA
jgi:hypothetical protein